MIPENPLCLKGRKSQNQWSKYVKGASAVFAWHISRGEKITVLSPPPPERFHPSELTNYQAIEEPILKGEIGGSAVLRIDEQCLILDPTRLYSKFEISCSTSTADLICYRTSGSELHSTFCAEKHWGERCIVAMNCLKCAFEARHNRREHTADEGVEIVGTHY
jgi:hypothetical protein